MNELRRYISERIIISVDALVERELGEEYSAHMDGVIFRQFPDKPYAVIVGEWGVKNNEIVISVKV